MNDEMDYNFWRKLECQLGKLRNLECNMPYLRQRRGVHTERPVFG